MNDFSKVISANFSKFRSYESNGKANSKNHSNKDKEYHITHQQTQNSQEKRINELDDMSVNIIQ